MKTKLFLAVTIALIATFGVAQADATDRFFQVQVKLVAAGTSPLWKEEGGIFPPNPPGPNCYSFLDDGTWIDPLFLNPFGTWVPNENGVITRYTATAEFPGGFGLPPLTLVQEGKITPSSGRGKVRLQAFSTLYITGTDTVLAQFVSTGYEVGGCPPL
jgi:hypothetical protein